MHLVSSNYKTAHYGKENNEYSYEDIPNNGNNIGRLNLQNLINQSNSTRIMQSHNEKSSRNLMNNMRDENNNYDMNNRLDDPAMQELGDGSMKNTLNTSFQERMNKKSKKLKQSIRVLFKKPKKDTPSLFDTCSSDTDLEFHKSDWETFECSNLPSFSLDDPESAEV